MLITVLLLVLVLVGPVLVNITGLKSVNRTTPGKTFLQLTCKQKRLCSLLDVSAKLPCLCQ